MTKRSRGALAPELRPTKNESSGPDPVGWPPAVVPAQSRSRPAQKNQEGGTPTDAYVQPPHPHRVLRLRGEQRRGRGARPAGRARLSAFHRGACGSEPTPPLSSSTRFLGRGRHQALPEARLSQSSEQLADRSWCRPGVCRNRPGMAATSCRPRNPHSPWPPASPGGRPEGRSEILATSVSEIGTNVKRSSRYRRLPAVAGRLERRSTERVIASRVGKNGV